MRLRQVLGNLLANVRAHTPAGTPVTVVVRPDAGRARLEVADRGPGMEPETAARVFERFYRADKSRARVPTRTAGGSGLGLSIVAAIADAHGGAAEVSSTAGVGSTFAVVLPLSPTSAPGAVPLEPVDAPPTEASRPRTASTP
jgi:two-component system OmpR family sensor kinase